MNTGSTRSRRNAPLVIGRFARCSWMAVVDDVLGPAPSPLLSRFLRFCFGVWPLFASCLRFRPCCSVSLISTYVPRFCFGRRCGDLRPKNALSRTGWMRLRLLTATGMDRQEPRARKSTCDIRSRVTAPGRDASNLGLVHAYHDNEQQWSLAQWPLLSTEQCC